MGNFERLLVWQQSRQLVADVYRITGTFPYEERFVLRQQLRRAAVSIVSNIAEGSGRGRRKEFLVSFELRADPPVNSSANCTWLSTSV